MYNYWIVSAEVTLIVISASTSECKEILTLNLSFTMLKLFSIKFNLQNYFLNKITIKGWGKACIIIESYQLK